MKKKFQVDFIGIGAEKAGSTWVSDCLREHPEVCFSKKKEVFFFNDRTYPLLRSAKHVKYGWGIKWYKSFFNHCEKNQIKGEFTPTYLYSKVTAQRIYKHNPNVKLIVILRNPLKRAMSAYVYDKRIGLSNDNSFEKALDNNQAYLEKGMYYKYLKEYFNIFPQNNIYVLTLNEVKDTPKKAIRGVYKFLGLKNVNFKPLTLHKKSQTAAEARFPKLNHVLRQSIYLIEKWELDLILKILDKIKIRKLFWWLTTQVNKKPLKKYPNIKRGTEEKLRKAYKKDVESLEKLIKKDLTSWK